MNTSTIAHNFSLRDLRNTSTSESRGWMILAGAALTILGLLALYASVATTFFSVLYVGALAIVAAIFQIGFAITSGRWLGLGLHLLLAVLYVVTGAFLMMNPLIGAFALTMIISFFFILSGSFRVVASLSMRFRQWGWACVSGLITAAIGIYVLSALPEITPYLVGALIAIDLIFFGCYLMTFGFTSEPLLSEEQTRSANNDPSPVH